MTVAAWRSRSARVPLTIVLSSISVALSIAMVVGWVLVVVRNMSLAKEAASTHTALLVGGILSSVVIVTVLVLFTVFLVREMREVRRQISFIDSVTHELKSPLASLKLCAETFARPSLESDKREDLRRMMLDDVQRLVGVVDGILDASRVGWRRPGRMRTPVDLRGTIETIVETATRRHKIERHKVTIDVPDDLEVVTDPQALEIVLQNLVDNAIKYSEEDVQVRVSARREGTRVVIEVQDHGIGIERRDLRRIFQRFFRAPEEAVRTRHGIGLGLFVVRALVREMRGRVVAESEGRGKGTLVRVTLPT